MEWRGPESYEVRVQEVGLGLGERTGIWVQRRRCFGTWTVRSLSTSGRRDEGSSWRPAESHAVPCATWPSSRLFSLQTRATPARDENFLASGIGGDVGQETEPKSMEKGPLSVGRSAIKARSDSPNPRLRGAWRRTSLGLSTLCNAAAR